MAKVRVDTWRATYKGIVPGLLYIPVFGSWPRTCGFLFLKHIEPLDASLQERQTLRQVQDANEVHK